MRHCIFERKVWDEVYCHLAEGTLCDKTKCPMWVTMKFLQKKGGRYVHKGL